MVRLAAEAFSSTWPSGLASATKRAPTAPPAPALFSTTTGWPSFGSRARAMVRATLSLVAPGV